MVGYDFHQPVMKYCKLSNNAYTPSQSSPMAAGLDLYSAYEYIVEANDKKLIKTDIAIQLPEGCYGRIAPRSGLALKNFIDVGAGVIDGDYRGNINVLLFNFSNTEYVVEKGARIAQLICEKIHVPALVEVKMLDFTERGCKGFGSSGL